MHTVPKLVYTVFHLIFIIKLVIMQNYYLYLIGKKTNIQIIGIVQIDCLEIILSITTIIPQK